VVGGLKVNLITPELMVTTMSKTVNALAEPVSTKT